MSVNKKNNINSSSRAYEYALISLPQIVAPKDIIKQTVSTKHPKIMKNVAGKC